MATSSSTAQTAQEQVAADAQVVEAAQAAAARAKLTGKHQIAAFDFDGTSIQGNSPVLLVRHLLADKLLRGITLLKISSWGIAYKLHLPQNEAWVRGLVFTAFEGKPQEQVDEYLRLFYDEDIAGQQRFRPQARAAMKVLRENGIEVALISATFGPIARRAKEFEPIDTVLSTEMAVDENGNYTRRVEGECIEGDAKVRVLTAWANETYGPGNWELACAFGDHHSDLPMLRAARTAFAITSDKTLGRAAKAHSWHRLNWECETVKPRG